MKLYSISFTAVVMALLWASLNLPDPGNNVNPTGRVGSVTKKPVRSFSGWHDGSWPGSSGYHSYGKYYIDATGIPTGNAVSVSWSVHDVPNRFYLQDECGLGKWASSGWAGTANYLWPWGMSIGTASGGTTSLLKVAGCNTYSVSIETSTSSTISDYWYAVF